MASGRERGCWSWALLKPVLLMLVALLPAKARAEEHNSTLLLNVAAPAAESARLESVTRELLQPLGVAVDVRRVERVELAELRRASAAAYFARAWVAFSTDGSARLYLEHGASDRVLVRDLPGDPSNAELVREELGHILQAAVEGLKAGEEVGEPRQEALQEAEVAPPAVVPRDERTSSPPPSERRALWRLGARYEARWLGDGPRLEDGPGVAVGLATRLGFELSSYYRRPFRIEAEPVGVRLETVSLRALATLAEWLPLTLGAGLGVDLVRVTPLAGGGEGLQVAGADWRKLALLRVQGTLEQRLGRNVELQLIAGADVDLSRTRYVLERPTGDVSVLEPAPVRPFLGLGAALP